MDFIDANLEVVRYFFNKASVEFAEVRNPIVPLHKEILDRVLWICPDEPMHSV